MSPELRQSTELLTRRLDSIATRRVSGGQFNDTTLRTIGGYGSAVANGYRPRPYQQDISLKWFSGLVYTLAMINANAFASVPLRMYVRTKGANGKRLDKNIWQTRPLSRSRRKWLSGEKHRHAGHRPSLAVCQKSAGFGDEFEEMLSPHPALRCLSAANEWQNGFDLSVLRLLFKQITGNAYLYPVIDPRLGVPVELWIAPSQLVRVVPATDGSWIKGWEYGRVGQSITFAADELIPFKYANLNDPYYGFGKVEAAWTALNVRHGKRLNDLAMFENGCRPDWALVFKEFPGADAMDRVEASIDAKFRGPRKAGQFLSIYGADIKPLQWAPAELGDDEEITTEICNVFGVPITKIKSSDPNRANAGIADTAWLRDTILPECRADEEQLNARYLPLFGIDEGDAFLAYDDPVPENEHEQANQIRLDLAAGITDLNEARLAKGDDEVPEDQNFRVIPMGAVLVSPKEGEDPEPNTEGTEGTEAKNDPKAKSLKRLPTLDEERARQQRERDASLAAVALLGWRPIAGQEMTPGLVSVFEAQRQQLLAPMLAAAQADPSKPPAVPSLASFLPLFAAIMLPYLVNGYRAGAIRAASDLQASPIDAATRRATLQGQALESAQLVNRTTASRLSAALATEWDKYEATPDAAQAVAAVQQAVETVIRQATTERAAIIAEHEALTAEALGAEETARASTRAYTKTWTLGPNPCPVCIAIEAHNAGGVGPGEDFVDPATRAAVTPPVHPRCQCEIRYRLTDGTTSEGL